MLKEVRRGLAKTLEVGLPTARVLPAPPVVWEWPDDGGPLVWVRPADPWIDAYTSFSSAGRATLFYEIVLALPPAETDDLDVWFSAMDDLLDPTTETGTVMAALLADDTLGISDFQCSADVMLSSVQAPDVAALGELNAAGFVAVVPVQIIVKRS